MSSRRAGWAIAGALVAAGLGLWLRGSSDERASGARAPRPTGLEESAPAAAPPAPALSPPALNGAAPARIEELHAALREDVERVPSDVAIETIDADRIRACPGEAVHLAARVTGDVPGAVQRWVWRTPGGAALHPGPAIAWQAPGTPGHHRIHFQVCTDLGSRRIGVLAERAVDIEVRACGPDELQRDGLRIAVTQRGHGVFFFEAVHAPGGRDDVPAIESYAWDFGDGTALATTAPGVEHRYVVDRLGAGDIAHFPVTLEARRAGAPALDASALALVRGQPPRDPSPVALEFARWRFDATQDRWESAITVRPSDGEVITWDSLERVTRYFDDRVEVTTLAWRDVIQVDGSLEGGGFRGQVLVDAASTPPEVKQVIDTLRGRTADGREVTLSWSPFKRTPPAPAFDGAAPPPSK